MSGGGGGDNSASTRAAAEDARKAEARKAVNRVFGYGDKVEAQTLPETQSQLVTKTRRSRGEDGWEDVEYQDMEDVKVGERVIPGYDPSGIKAQREAQISEIANSNLDLNKTALEEQKAESARQLKFALSRSGLRGGSADAGLSNKVQQTYSDQLRTAVAGSDEIAANLRTADEEARLRMLGQVEAGADQDALLAGSADTLRSNIDRANASAKGNIISGAFDDIGAGIRGAVNKRAEQDVRNKRAATTPGMALNSHQGTIFRG